MERSWLSVVAGSLMSSQSPLFPSTGIFPSGKSNQTSLATTPISPSLSLFFSSSVKVLEAHPISN